MKSRKTTAAALVVSLICVATLPGCIGVAATGAAVGGVVAQERRTPGNLVDDGYIELKVRAAIRKDKAMASQIHINATSFNGLVLLTGEAPGKSLRDRIVEITRGTPGVRAVQNEIALQAPSTLVARTSDTLVTGRVKLALLGEKGLEATRVKVVTERGIVYLMGLLKQHEADGATETVRRVPGVQRVVKVIEYIE
ncbi:MAG: BON domain-containing protein [Thiotrichales bacterium]|nr:BON domain-containing protein [Thiotrichales bacterium]MCY4286935.1 BON domain-containing protein [Thiotrichales bacterium]MCY4348392.1 BON domain-containing protein [Thiotrichales bacterium]